MLKRILDKKSAMKWAAFLFAAASAVMAFNLNSAPEVRVETVKRGNIIELVELQGKVELDTAEKIYARIEGFVDGINAYEGDEVEAGNKLLEISSDNLRFAISKAEAAQRASKSQLQSLKSSIKPEHIMLAEAQLEQAKAAEDAALKDLSNKRDNCEKLRLLHEKGAFPEKDLKDAETMLTAAESSFRNAFQAVKIAQYNLDILEEGVSKDEIKVFEANVTAANVQVEELLYDKGRTDVYSPIRGTVLEKNVEKGQIVMPGILLYEIGNYDSAYIRADVLVDDIAKIEKGQKVIISGDVLNDEEIQGEVYYIAPKAEGRVSSLGIEQQRVEVRIKFDNAGSELKPGYTLDADIAVQEKSNTLYVPDKSVFKIDGKDSVFVVKNSRLEPRTIVSGLENDDFIEVISGVSEGEIVVVDPDSELKPGKRVKFKKINLDSR
ncbi:MAG TPA: efflux RND transporter periplasmic adaptor subunit [Bacillota bacterium]|nr:efflux RND transporter periplasmic adaptor subunit [Bacillota bacterium]